MKSRHFQYTCLTFLLLFFVCRSANADRIARLYCDKNSSSFLVRFGVDDDPIEVTSLVPLTEVLNKKFNSLKFEENDRCTLKNGDKVSLNYSLAQAYAYGTGGADPDAFFYLTINGKKIYYGKTFYGDDGEFYNLSSIYYQNKKLQECRLVEPSENDENREYHFSDDLSIINRNRIKCSYVNKRLSGRSLEKNELYFVNINQKREKMARSVSRECKKMYASYLGNEIRVNTADHDPGPSKIDINNDGNLDKVYEVSGFRNDEHLVAFVDKKKKWLQDFINLNYHEKVEEAQTNQDSFIKCIKERGVCFISLGDNESSVRPFRHNHKVYIMALMGSINDVPEEVIYKITPENKPVKICQFPSHNYMASDREGAELAIAAKGGYLEYLPPSWRNEKKIVKIAIRQDPSAFDYASEELQRDPEIIMGVLKACSSQNSDLIICYEILTKAPKNLLNKKSFVMQLADSIKNSCKLFGYGNSSFIGAMPEKFWHDKDFMLKAAKLKCNHHMLFDRLPEELRSDTNFMIKMIESYPIIYSAMSANMKNNEEFFVRSGNVFDSPTELQERIKNDKQLLIRFIQNYPGSKENLLELFSNKNFFPTDPLKNKDVAAAVKNKRFSTKFVGE